MMKRILVVTMVILLTIVGQVNAFEGKHLRPDFSNAKEKTLQKSASDDETTTYYVVVVGRGHDYDKLYAKMNSLNKKLGVPIDLMGRTYNKERNLIALPEDDEDEMYAGEYYPKNFPSESLSLEYLYIYQRKVEYNVMVLIAGIYEKKEDAARMLKKIIKEAPKAYVLKAQVYTGCMH